MIHPDGIEVYLKPADRSNDDVKWPDIPIPLDFYGGHVGSEKAVRSMVLQREEDFTIAVNFLPHFDMFSASAVRITLCKRVTRVLSGPITNRITKLGLQDYGAVIIQRSMVGNLTEISKLRFYPSYRNSKGPTALKMPAYDQSMYRRRVSF